MIVDTCVWVEHFRGEVDALSRLCRDGRAFVHHDVFGEVMLGCGEERDEIVEEIRLLPPIGRPSLADIEVAIKSHGIACKRIGWVDAVLLCTAMIDVRGPSLMTFDKKLLREAIRLGVAFAA